MERNLTHTAIFHEQYNQLLFIAMDTATGQLFSMWETEKKWRVKGYPLEERNAGNYTLNVVLHQEFQQYYFSTLDKETGQLFRMWFSEDTWTPIGDSIYLSEVPELVRQNA
ncbi:MAG TPA: hypothetical protein VIK89_04345 [Cytophagaceae bacterium]